MRSLVSAEDIDNLEMLDSSRLLNLYARYRALPGSLTDDQTGLIYASLCVARHTQLRGSVAGGMVDPYTLNREDVTYYRMARESLRLWGRASITSMCKYKSDETSIDLQGLFSASLLMFKYMVERRSMGKYWLCGRIRSDLWDYIVEIPLNCFRLRI